MSLHLLTIGTNYTGTTSELYGCANDARDIAKIVKPAARSTATLLDNKVDWDGFYKAGRKWLDRLEPGDDAWLTLSGHGTTEPDRDDDERTGCDQAFVLSDFELIFDDEVAALLRDRPKDTRVFLFLDCCHSGTPMRAMRRPRSIPFSRCRRHKRERFPHTLRSLSNVVSFSGCGDGPADYSYDARFNGRANGAFSHFAFKQAWKELPAGASYRSWFSRIGGKQGYLPNADYPQVPQCNGSSRNLSRALPL